MNEYETTTEQTKVSIGEARELFPGAQRWIYMDVSLRGLISSPVRLAVDSYLDERLYNGGDKQWMLDKIQYVRERFARFVNADSVEIAYTKNVSEGLNTVAGALPFEAGDNVVVCPELEHPNNVYLWYNLRKRLGVDVRAVSPHDGRVPVEDMIGRIDERTRLVTVPSVTFSPGFITDVKTLAEACRQRGVFLLVDAAQSVGILHTDVRELGVDALTVATQKGLLAFYGMGFLYCREEWAERLWPVSLARFGVDLGAAHETALGEGDLRLQPGARRFDLGNYNYLAAVAADASIGLLLDLGSREIEAYVRGLSRRLAAGLNDLGLPVCGGAPGDHTSHIVTVGRLGGGHDTTSDAEMSHLYQQLVTNGVKLSVRKGVLRFSLHVYNNEEDVDRVIELAREWKNER
jgi:cysteine desulfurase/selenocysteine lyase